MPTDRQRILEGRHRDPYCYLGMHAEGAGLVVRAFHPTAASIEVVGAFGEGIWKMQRTDPAGIFEVSIPERAEIFGYDLSYTAQIQDAEDEKAQTVSWRTRDPYSFLPVIGEYDLHLFNEGNHYFVHNRLGAHLKNIGGVEGTHFAVWAPNAERASVVGDFNNWDGRVHAMRMLGTSGVWEIFIPGIAHGELYKFELRGPTGDLYLKTDPYGFYCEKRPATGSIVWNIDDFEWDDAEFMDRRAQHDFQHAPMSVYEVHLGSWMRSLDGEMLDYRALGHRLAEHASGMGFTHVELLPVAEHPLDESWGYQVGAYFAPTSRFGTPQDFMTFVETLHQHNIGVLVDWVPAHFPRDAHGLAWFDGTALYEHADPRQGEHLDWGTKIFNYGRHEVRNFLLSNALFWLERYHIDGLRVDAVASMLYLDYSRKEGEWVPNRFGGRENIEAIDFLKQLNEVVHELHPGAIVVAEESTAWPGVSRPTYVGGLGFTMKWNMGWMNDILEFFQKDPVHRKYHHRNLTFAMLYAFHENFVLALSHDEVVHGKRSLIEKMPGDMWQKFANMRLLMGYMYAQPGKKLLFMGAEFGQWSEWNSGKSLDWHLTEYRPHWALMRYLGRLNHLHKTEPALHEFDFDGAGFAWIDFSDTENNVLTFLRRARNPDDYVICIFNATPVPRQNYKIGVPDHCLYREIMNSDSEMYWGSNMGNAGAVHSEPGPSHGFANTLTITVPPLGVLYLKPAR